MVDIVNGINGNVLKLKEKGFFFSEKKMVVYFKIWLRYFMVCLFMYFVVILVVMILNDLFLLFVFIMFGKKWLYFLIRCVFLNILDIF